jgi:AAA+ superfamily predicted ATPase
MENNDSFKLKDLIHLQGKGWKYNAPYRDGDYYYPNSAVTASYAYIVLDKTNKEITFRINCNVFENETEQKICKQYIQSDLSFTDVYNEQHLYY